MVSFKSLRQIFPPFSSCVETSCNSSPPHSLLSETLFILHSYNALKLLQHQLVQQAIARMVAICKGHFISSSYNKCICYIVCKYICPYLYLPGTTLHLGEEDKSTLTRPLGSMNVLEVYTWELTLLIEKPSPDCGNGDSECVSSHPSLEQKTHSPFPLCRCGWNPVPRTVRHPDLLAYSLCVCRFPEMKRLPPYCEMHRTRQVSISLWAGTKPMISRGP